MLYDILSLILNSFRENKGVTWRLNAINISNKDVAFYTYIGTIDKHIFDTYRNIYFKGIDSVRRSVSYFFYTKTLLPFVNDFRLEENHSTCISIYISFRIPHNLILDTIKKLTNEERQRGEQLIIESINEELKRII